MVDISDRITEEQSAFAAQPRAGLAKWGSDACGERPRRWRGRVADTIVILAITWFVLPGDKSGPTAGLDPSWMTGLAMGLQDDLAYGKDLQFTYGPLGFVSNQILFLPRPWLLALVANVLATLALVAISYHLLRRRLPLWMAAGMTALTILYTLDINAGHLFVVLQAIAILVAIDTTVSTKEVSQQRTLAMGAYAGLVTLVKVDAGLFCGSVMVLGVVANLLKERSLTSSWVPTMRKVGAFLAAWIGATVVAWALLGQPLATLIDWLLGSLPIAAGYAENMGTTVADRDGLFVAAFAFSIWLGVETILTRTATRRTRFGIGVVLSVVGYLAFRQGFVRYSGHVLSFFTLLIVVGIAMSAVWGVRRSAAFTAAVIAATGMLVALDLPVLLNPTRPFGTTVAAARIVTDASHREGLIEESRASVRKELGFSSALLAPAGGRSIHISPWEASVAYAYPDLAWRPLPVFQDYAAYTTALDEKNFQVLESSQRPEFILRQPGVAIDARLARWEAPHASMEMVCRYRDVNAEGGWRLLEATSNRCGDIVPRSRGEAMFGDVVPVPPGSGIVVVRFSGLNDTVLDRARTLAFKSRQLFVDLGTLGRYRFVTGTQGSWHVMAAPSCALQALDSLPSFETVTFSTAGDRAEGKESFAYEFAEVPFQC
jgi:hypothetical protein